MEKFVDLLFDFGRVVALLRACVENEAGPPGSWTEEQVIEGERERERLAYVWAKKRTGTQTHIYIRINTEYASGYNRSGRRNRCRCLFVFALRGYDGGTAGSTRAFLEAARASRKPAERKVMANGQRRSVRFWSDSTSSSLMRDAPFLTVSSSFIVQEGSHFPH